MTIKNESNTPEDSFKPYPNDNKELRKLIDKAWIEAETAHLKYKQNANDRVLYFAKIDPLIIEYHVTMSENDILAYRHDKSIEIYTSDKFFGVTPWNEPRLFTRLKSPSYTFSFN